MLQRPAQQHLGAGLAMAFANRHDRRVIELVAMRQRTVSRERDALGGAELEQLALVQKRAELDLVVCRNHVGVAQ